MKKLYFIATTMLLVLSLTVHAQEGGKTGKRKLINQRFNELYLRNAEIGYLTLPYCFVGNDYNFLMTASIVPHYYVFPKTWPIGLVITPKIDIRIIDSASFPLRTPDFWPGSSMFIRLTKDTTRYRYLTLAYMHHSNGQDGRPLNPDSSLNYYNGNFNTNFVEIAFNFGKQTLEGNNYFRLGLEAHTGLIERWDEPKLRDRFGKLRVNYHFASSSYITSIARYLRKSSNPSMRNEETWRTTLEGMVILDNLVSPMIPRVKPVDISWNQMFNIELKIYRKIRESYNTALFLSFGYMGHDTYNIHFDQSYPFVKFGIAAGNSFLLRTIKQ